LYRAHFFRGDVSALHDVGSLALAAHCSAPLVLVVVNNGGGRIFEQLPVAAQIDADTLLRLFLTPPPVFLEGACNAFGIANVPAYTTAALSSALIAALRAPRATLIEVRPSQSATAEVRRASGAQAVGGAA
jgi:2-succinyl-5-enolpyruvyl-6-hydroxy-3-cyclohexene-1-carboxylate synthase